MRTFKRPREELFMIGTALALILFIALAAIWVITVLAENLAASLGPKSAAPVTPPAFHVSDAEAILRARGLLQ